MKSMNEGIVNSKFVLKFIIAYGQAFDLDNSTGVTSQSKICKILTIKFDSLVALNLEPY